MSGRHVTVSDVAIVACAVSAGIHAALAPAHLHEGRFAGAAFAASAVVLGGLAVWLTARPAGTAPLAVTATALAGLLGAYALAVTTGVPLLHAEPEPVDPLALFTKAAEAAGLVAALAVVQRRHVSPTSPRTRGTNA